MIRKKKIGPMNPRFNLSVASYIRSNPTHRDSTCLRNFFTELTRTGVTVPCVDISPAVTLVSACGYIITFTNYGARVKRIERGVLSDS